MKKMTCKQLGGACDTEFHANTFEEMADLSKKHALEKIMVIFLKSINYLPARN